MRNNNYVIMFTLAMTTVVALVLSGLFYSTKPMAERNEAVFNKRAILSAISDYLPNKLDEMSDEEVLGIFENEMEQVVIDMEGDELENITAEQIDMAQEEKKPVEERYLPVYIYNSNEGKIYILSVRGNGLWDKIWGSVALKDDFNTVVGVAFDHAGETPGLGAEIKDNKMWVNQFKGKKIYDGAEYKSITVRKGGAKDQTFEVDGISGATVTSDGVSEMLNRGIQYYESYFEGLKNS